MASVSSLMSSPQSGPGPRRSQADGSGRDAVVKRPVESDERLTLGVVEVDDVVGGAGIEALALQMELRVLEGRRQLQRGPQAQEQRPRVGRQAAAQVASQRRQVQGPVGDEGGHAGPTVGAGDGHAVGGRLADTGKRAERLGDLGRRDVLALPAERLADAMDEVVVAGLVLAHQVAGAKPGIARLEDVAKDLALGGLGAGVPLESSAGGRRMSGNPADRLADLAGRTADPEAGAVPNRPGPV